MLYKHIPDKATPVCPYCKYIYFYIFNNWTTIPSFLFDNAERLNPRPLININLLRSIYISLPDKKNLFGNPTKQRERFSVKRQETL